METNCDQDGSFPPLRNLRSLFPRGSGAVAPAVKAAIAESGLARQALHAAVLGFVHPITGVGLRFETGPPDDLARLQRALEII